MFVELGWKVLVDEALGKAVGSDAVLCAMQYSSEEPVTPLVQLAEVVFVITCFACSRCRS